MGFMSDIKSTRLTESGTVFGGRSRVKGIYVVPGANAGTVTLKDGGASGVTTCVLDTSAAGDATYLHLPEDGILCSTDSYVVLADVAAVTVFYA